MMYLRIKNCPSCQMRKLVQVSTTGHSNEIRRKSFVGTQVQYYSKKSIITNRNQFEKSIVVDGKKLAQHLLMSSKQEISNWIRKGNRKPSLSIILIGNHEPSKIYVRNKLKASRSVGIFCNLIELPHDTSICTLVNIIKKLNDDPEVDGILVQLPLPTHMKERDILDKIKVQKDVDGFHSENIGKLALNLPTFVPCTAAAIVEILKHYEVATKGKNVVICNRSKHVGLPIAMILHSDGEVGGFDATTTICHRYTPAKELKYHLKSADIIISATGIPNFIKGDMVNEGCSVIDIGMARYLDEHSGIYKLHGDVHYDSVKEKAALITPVPGGVGPLTVSCLVKNTILAAKHFHSQ